MAPKSFLSRTVSSENSESVVQMKSYVREREREKERNHLAGVCQNNPERKMKTLPEEAIHQPLESLIGLTVCIPRRNIL